MHGAADFLESEGGAHAGGAVGVRQLARAHERGVRVVRHRVGGRRAGAGDGRRAEQLLDVDGHGLGAAHRRRQELVVADLDVIEHLDDVRLGPARCSSKRSTGSKFHSQVRWSMAAPPAIRRQLALSIGSISSLAASDRQQRQGNSDSCNEQKQSAVAMHALVAVGVLRCRHDLLQHCVVVPQQGVQCLLLGLRHAFLVLPPDSGNVELQRKLSKNREHFKRLSRSYRRAVRNQCALLLAGVRILPQARCETEHQHRRRISCSDCPLTV